MIHYQRYNTLTGAYVRIGRLVISRDRMGKGRVGLLFSERHGLARRRITILFRDHIFRVAWSR